MRTTRRRTALLLALVFLLASRSAKPAAAQAANQPPTVTIVGPVGYSVPTITVYAGSPAGAYLQLLASAFDPDGDALTYSWSGPFTNSPVLTDYQIIGGLSVGT